MKIVGIDIGSSSIKAVEFDSNFGRFDIYDYHEQTFEKPDDLEIALKVLVQSLARKPDRVAVSLPASRVTHRNLSLPTKSKKAIRAAVGFELDDELPFEGEDLIFDYSILKQSKNSAEVHIAASLKSYLVELLDLLRQAGLDPDLVTSEAWAYRTFFNHFLRDEEGSEPVGLVNIGKYKTDIYIHHDGIPILCREFAWGGQRLTDAIAQKYDLSMEEAEKAKIDSGFVLPSSQMSDADKEQIEFSEILYEPIADLAVEIRHAVMTTKAVSRKNLSQIYLSGNTSLLPGFRQLIQEEANTRTTMLSSLSSLSTSGIAYSEHTDAAYLMAASLCLSLIAPDRASAINLRKAEFAKESVSKFDWKTIKVPAMWAIATFFILSVSVFLEDIIYDIQIKKLEKQISVAARPIFGSTVSKIAMKSLIKTPSKLKSKIDSELKALEKTSILFSSNPNSPIDFLIKLSESIPSSITVDMTKFEVGTAPGNPYGEKEKATIRLKFQ